MDSVWKVKRELPKGSLIVSYATVGCDYNKIVKEVAAGVNVLVWFSSSLLKDSNTEKPFVSFNWDVEVIGRIQQRLIELNLKTTHLVCVGGWNAPRPDMSFTGKEWFEAWEDWNNQLQSQHPDFTGFDGIDWDLEGNDDGTYDTINPTVLNIVGEMSQELKKNGYIVSLVPPQSYFDVQTSGYSDNIYLSPTDPWHQDFQYTGRNVYAYWVAKFGTTSVDKVVNVLSEESNLDDLEGWEIVRTSDEHVSVSNNIRSPQGGKELRNAIDGVIHTELVPTFDFIDVQLYESYSRSGYAIEEENMSFSDYFVNVYLKALQCDKWIVQFSAASELPNQEVKFSVMNQLVIGFGATKLNDKMTYISPDEIEEAWKKIQSSQLEAPRGLMFWELKLEPDDINDPRNMASRFNKILHTRTD